MDVKYGYRRAQGFDISGTRFGFFAIMQDEPQGAANSPRLSNRFGGLVLLWGLPVLADWEPLQYYSH